MVNRMLKLGTDFLHIPVSFVGLNNIHDLMVLFIIYVIVDGVMSISIGDHYVWNEVVGELCDHMRLSCSYQILKSRQDHFYNE